MYIIKQFANDFEAGNIRLIFIGRGYSKEYRGSYNRYAVYAGDLKLDHNNTDFMKKVPYYSTRGEALAMSVWGMSQEFEAQATLTRLAMYERLGKYDHDYFYKYVDKSIKVLGY